MPILRPNQPPGDRASAWPTARERLHHAMDTLNQTFGNGSVFYGGAFGAKDSAPMRIAFTRTPTPELEEIDLHRKAGLGHR